MGWANCGTDDKGRPIGYAHAATCDEPGCRKKIDRGLSYVCGSMHGGDGIGCGEYFCGTHLICAETTDGRYVSLCGRCYEIAEHEGALTDD